jgi:hypothetical protein
MRGDAYAEMFWTGNEDWGGYGMMNKHGEPWPVFHAKKLCAQHIRYGDWISFPSDGHDDSVDVVVARGEDGRRSVLFVHLEDKAASYSVANITGCADYQRLLKIDAGTSNNIVEAELDGMVRFDGYGVAALSSAPGCERI